MFAYKIDVLAELKKKGCNTTMMRREKLLGENAIQAIREDKVVGIIALHKICEMLKMQPGDIIYYYDENDKNAKKVVEIQKTKKKK